MYALFPIWVSLALAGEPGQTLNSMESIVEPDLVWVSTQESTPEVPVVAKVDPALETRLLGDLSGSEIRGVVPSSVSVASPHWLWIVGGLCVAAVGFGVRSRVTTKAVASKKGMHVVERVVLQGNNGLTVVDVAEAEGTVRRLLVGTGAGSPVLVADLGLVKVESDSSEAPSVEEVLHTPDTGLDLEAELENEAAYVVVPAAQQRAPEPYRVVAARAVLEEVIAERNDTNRASKLYEAQR